MDEVIDHIEDGIAVAFFAANPVWNILGWRALRSAFKSCAMLFRKMELFVA